MQYAITILFFKTQNTAGNKQLQSWNGKKTDGLNATEQKTEATQVEFQNIVQPYIPPHKKTAMITMWDVATVPLQYTFSIILSG